MDKLEEIKEALDKLYGHLAITEEREAELIRQGYSQGKIDGAKSGYERGFEDGFNEGKIFPSSEVSNN